MRPPNLYETKILAEAPRALSLLDRQAASRTAGSADRTFWGWKFTDFSGARFQESVCVLSYLYAAEIEGSRYRKNPALLAWIRLGLEWWCGLQHPDGSFDEAYPYERSLAATAFTSFYVSEALGFLGDDLDQATEVRVVAALARAGLWLVGNDEHHGFLSNHLAAAAAALEHIHQLTDDPVYRERSRHFLEKILAHQSTEGWYDEYGGADPGYQTHGCFYLARLVELTGDETLKRSLSHAIGFQALFIHPDGSLGGEYTSRNTQTYYPAAFEMLAGVDAQASWIARTMRPHVATGHVADLGAVDVWNYFVFLNNYVFAARAHATVVACAPREPMPGDGEVWFREAGLLRVRRRHYDAWFGARKGGVVKAFDRRTTRLAFADCGYAGRSTNGKSLATQQERSSEVGEHQPGVIAITGGLYELSRPVMTPLKFLLFRVFMGTVGRSKRLGLWVKNLLVKVLIYKKRPLDVLFTRTVHFADDAIVVEDALKGPGGARVETLRWSPAFTTIHMGSSKYFVDHELDLDTVREAAEAPIRGSEIAAGVVRTRQVRFD